MFLSLFNLPLCSFCTCEFPWMCLNGLVWLGHQSLLSSAVQRSLGHRTDRYLHPQEKYPRLLYLLRSKKKKTTTTTDVQPSLISRTAEREAVPTFSATLNLKKDQLLTIFTLLRPKRSESFVKLWTTANSDPAVECSSNSSKFENQSRFQSIWILVINYF